MPSQARLDANRRNALHSTGPRTAAGKARSAQNALKHGLASLSPDNFLAIEDRAAFDQLLASYCRTYSPAHADELDLLTEAVFCKWRQQRLWTVEAQGLELAIAEHQYDLQKRFPKAGPAAHLAAAVTRTAESTQLLRRYEAQLARQYHRNLKLLRELQASRLDLEPTLDAPEPESEPAPEPASPTSAPNEPNAASTQSPSVPEPTPVEARKTPNEPKPSPSKPLQPKRPAA